MKTKSLFLPTALILLNLATAGRADPTLDDARAALRAGDLAGAEARLAPRTAAGSSDAAALIALSEVRLAQKNTPAAIELAEQATKLDGKNPEYFTQLGRALGQRMGEISFLQQAFYAGRLRKAFAKVVELDPHNVAGLIGLARYYSNAPEIAGGSTEKANEFARRVKQEVPFLGELELGHVARHDEQYAEALAHYEEAVRLNPGLAEAPDLCGQMLVKLGRQAEARRCFEQALKLNPGLESAKSALAALAAPTG